MVHTRERAGWDTYIASLDRIFFQTDRDHIMDTDGSEMTIEASMEIIYTCDIHMSCFVM